jgi:predicted nuclease of restriction endonuclease-like (RecB) superfamily
LSLKNFHGITRLEQHDKIFLVMIMTEVTHTKDYVTFLNTIKRDIQSSRLRAVLAVNKELIHLYWRIGEGILEKQKELGWGSKVIEQLSLDLKHSFPEIKGFSKQNLWYMRQFASEYNKSEIIQQTIGEIPWGHNIDIVTKLKDNNTRFWYVKKTIENGWSRNVLSMHIEAETHLKLGAAQTNFNTTLPNPTSDLAQQLIKSEYNFEFLAMADTVHEKVIEKGLIDHIRNFLLELGNGFAFMGSQYRITLAGEEFFIDLLMYHVKLKAYIVIELKSGAFKPEYVGKLGFYTTAIDHEIKDDLDNPTIGLLLCQSTNKMMVEYCLKDTNRPMGIAEYKTLPKKYENILPTPEQFQNLINTIEIKQ